MGESVVVGKTSGVGGRRSVSGFEWLFWICEGYTFKLKWGDKSLLNFDYPNHRFLKWDLHKVTQKHKIALVLNVHQTPFWHHFGIFVAGLCDHPVRLLKTILSAYSVYMVHQKRGQRSAMGHMSVRVQPWQHVTAPNALTFSTDCCWTIKSLQDEHVSVNIEMSHENNYKEKGPFQREHNRAADAFCLLSDSAKRHLLRIVSYAVTFKPT